MNVEYISINELKKYAKNAKNHSKKQVKQIANSIRQFGMNDPIAIWGKENLIVSGHGRYEACKLLGMDEVPVIRLDHLSDEERRAYTLAHNKVAESDWDFDLLNEEIDDLIAFDFEDFGFQFVDEEQNKIDTQKKVENILNLGKANYLGVGLYDVPQLQPIHEEDLGLINEWIGFNYVLSDKEPEGKAVHFFLDDYQFQRLWNNPEKYLDKLSKYEAVLTPDFSPYSDMPMATQIFNHYRKHWLGRLMQEYGIKVIPTIRASRDERSLQWYLDGEPEGGVVCISSMWTAEKEAREYFLREFNTMVETLKPQKIYVYGNEVEEIEFENIEYIAPFTRKRFDE